MYSAEQAMKNLLQQNISVEAGVLLSEYVTFRVGGPCTLLVKPNAITELQLSLIHISKMSQVNFTFLAKQEI